MIHLDHLLNGARHVGSSRGTGERELAHKDMVAARDVQNVVAGIVRRIVTARGHRKPDEIKVTHVFQIEPPAFEPRVQVQQHFCEQDRCLTSTGVVY